MAIAPRQERNSENDLLRDCRQENRKTRNRQANSRIFCGPTTRQGLDFVEGSTPSKTKKRKQPVQEEPVVEAPASIARMNEGRMNVKHECETTDRPMQDHASARDQHHWRKGRMR
jgi:hypothetical protein